MGYSNSVTHVEDRSGIAERHLIQLVLAKNSRDTSSTLSSFAYKMLSNLFGALTLLVNQQKGHWV